MLKKMVLIAEADTDQQLLIRRAFDENGFDINVSFVRTGASVLTYMDNVRKQGELDELPGLIILDLDALGKDGESTLIALKKHPIYKKIPVLSFSSNDQKEIIERAYLHGANSYIVKPSDHEQYIAAIKNMYSYWVLAAALPSLRIH